MKREIHIIHPDKPEELYTLISLFAEVFEMKKFTPPSMGYLRELLKKDTFLSFVATAEGEIVGGLTAYILDSYYSEKPQVYLYDLGVLPAQQRQGIGRLLITSLKEYCRVRDYAEVFVQADEVDHHAIEFYRSTTPSYEVEAIQFAYRL